MANKKEMNERNTALMKQPHKSARGKLTPKRKKFARLVAKTGSKTEAYIQAFDVSDSTLRSTIHQEASRTASIPAVKAEIERGFERNGLTFDDVLTIHKRNMTQDEHLPTSQRAVTDYYELTGHRKAAAAPTVNVAFVINRAEPQEGVEVRTHDGGSSQGPMLDVTHTDDEIIDAA